MSKSKRNPAKPNVSVEIVRERNIYDQTREEIPLCGKLGKAFKCVLIAGPSFTATIDAEGRLSVNTADRVTVDFDQDGRLVLSRTPHPH